MTDFTLLKAKHEVSEIVHFFNLQFEAKYQVPVQVKKTLRALTLCRTEALGGHISKCGGCGKEAISYNSCRNRHCPKCQTVNKERWIIQRESELLPVAYYHIVFTLPHCFNDLLPKYSKELYGSLFKAAWYTIKIFGEDPKYLGAKAGMISILHTWGQQLWLHPHLHCIVPGGGLSKAGHWKNAKGKNRYLFPKRAMSLVYRAKFMEELRKRITIPQSIAKQAFKKKWVVYAKRPFSSPKTVVEYLGRYTHKVAISNHRIVDVNSKTVTIDYKDYRAGGKKKQTRLTGVEFLRRFSTHVLPPGFVRIRHYGFLASRNKPTDLNIAKKCLGEKLWTKTKLSWKEIANEKLGFNPDQCPACKQGKLKIIKVMIPDRGPPKMIQINA